jgi:glycosyltransferase involved in cell wall biosynthesis
MGERKVGTAQVHAVIVDGDLSYPATSGKRLRTLHLMLRLARRHRVTYIARGQAAGEEARQARACLGDHGIETLVVDDPVARKSGPWFYARLAANLLSPLPYAVASHQSRLMRRAVRSYAGRHRVDLWQVEWSPYLATLPEGRDTRKLVVAHNVESLIWQRYHAAEANPAKRWYIKRQWRKFERFEARAFRQATRVVAVSQEDAAIIRARFGMPRVDVVDNGIDKGYYGAVEGCRDPNRILFLGSLEWRPNLDAVGVLLDRVFPAVRRQFPAARLCLVGRNPPPALVERVRGLEGVELHANVADVRPYLGGCGVMAVPLRIGGGSRLKILEALAAGLPVVSTRVGAEGLCLQPGRDLDVVEGVEELADALVGCLRDPARARERAAHGRRLVLDRYDWDALADKLEAVWESCLLKTPEPAVLSGETA